MVPKLERLLALLRIQPWKVRQEMPGFFRRRPVGFDQSKSIHACLQLTVVSSSCAPEISVAFGEISRRRFDTQNATRRQSLTDWQMDSYKPMSSSLNMVARCMLLPVLLWCKCRKPWKDCTWLLEWKSVLDNTGQNMPSHEEMHFLAFEFTTKKDR